MRLIIFFVAIALAAGAFVLTSQLTYKTKEETGLPVVKPEIVVKDVPTVDIYVAKIDIPIGAIIKPEMLDIQPFPKNLMLDGMVAADPNTSSDIVKMVSRTYVQKGEPLFMSKLGNEKDPGFLAAALPKGMRMVTIAVDTVSGVGNFVYPGDRVDVLITHDVMIERYKTAGDAKPATPGGASDPNKRSAVTEILLPNVKIMAVNQKSIIRGNEPPAPLNNVSIEVSPLDAQKLRLTENGNGKISLALRSLKDQDENELARPTGVSDLSRLTPPAYFPVLYDSTGNTSETKTEKTEEQPLGMRSIVNVIRGTKASAVEVSQP